MKGGANNPGTSNETEFSADRSPKACREKFPTPSHISGGTLSCIRSTNTGLSEHSVPCASSKQVPRGLRPQDTHPHPISWQWGRGSPRLV